MRSVIRTTTIRFIIHKVRKDWIIFSMIKIETAKINYRHNLLEVKSTAMLQEDILNNLNNDYKIACILDEFSYKSFQHESRLSTRSG